MSQASLSNQEEDLKKEEIDNTGVIVLVNIFI